MICGKDFQCPACQTMTLQGEEYGTAWNFNKEKHEALCILCIQSAELLMIEVKV
jgi:hypothetical protein